MKGPEKYVKELFEYIQKVYNDMSSVVDGYSSNQFDRLTTALMYVAFKTMKTVNAQSFS